MTSTRLDVVADTQASAWARSGSVMIAFAKPRLVRQLSLRKGPVQCPECHSIVYSRRHKLCGVCSQPLPDDLLFTAHESDRIQRILDAERARHRQWLAERSAVV